MRGSLCLLVVGTCVFAAATTCDIDALVIPRARIAFECLEKQDVPMLAIQVPCFGGQGFALTVILQGVRG